MGNSFGCSASGERLVSAARDGDLIEAKMLLNCNPCLAKYSTFGGLNSPLHFAAAKGHNEVVLLFPLSLFFSGLLLFCSAGDWSLFRFLISLLFWVWFRLFLCCSRMELMSIPEITVARLLFQSKFCFVYIVVCKFGHFNFCLSIFWHMGN